MKITYVMVAWSVGGSISRHYRLIKNIAENEVFDVHLIINRNLHQRLASLDGDLPRRVRITYKYDGRLTSRFDLFDDEIKKMSLYAAMPWNLQSKFMFVFHSIFRKRILWLLDRTVKLDDADIVHWIRPFGMFSSLASMDRRSVFAMYDFEIRKFHWRFSKIKKMVGLGGKFDCLSPDIAKAVRQIAGADSSDGVFTAPCSYIKMPTGQCDFEDKKDIVVFSGRFIDIKQPDLFVKSAVIALQNEVDCEFLLLGDGPLKGSIEALIPIEYKERFRIEWVDDPISLVINAKIFVSLQLGNNYPSQSLMEGMACGCAVVATDEGETGLLVDEKVGVLVSSDEYQIAEVLGELMTDQNRLKTMGENAQNRIKAEFTIEKYACYIKKVYGLEESHIVE